MVGWSSQDFVLVLLVSRHSGSAAEMDRVELSGSRRAEEGLVALVPQPQLERPLFWAVEGSQCQQELGLSEGVARRAQLALTGQRWHSCWLR